MESAGRGVVSAAEAAARRLRPRPVARRSLPRSSHRSEAEAAQMKPAEVAGMEPRMRRPLQSKIFL